MTDKKIIENKKEEEKKKKKQPLTNTKKEPDKSDQGHTITEDGTLAAFGFKDSYKE